MLLDTEESFVRCSDLSAISSGAMTAAIAGRDAPQRRNGCADPVTDSSSRCATLVAVVQTADLWEGNNGACGGWLCGTRLGASPVQREMRAALVVILKICQQHTAQVTFIEDDNLIETFAADRADDALDIGVLPWRSRCCDDLLDRLRCRNENREPTADRRVIISTTV
jgi:hypothetical protein